MLVFTPALSGPYQITPDRIRKEFKFWREDALVHVPDILVSYGMVFTMGNSPVFRNISDYYGFNKNRIIIADSGGFEIFTHKVTIPVEDVLEWQFRNANRIIALDMPPRGMGKIEDVTNWEKCKEFTYKNTNALVKYASSRKADNVKIYGVVHGISLGELEDWWESVIKPFEGVLDGVSYAVRPPGNPNSVMLALAHARSKGVKNLHVLGVTGTKTLIPIAYASDWFELLTTDSSSFTKIAGRGRVMCPVALKYCKVGVKGKKITDYTSLPCPCPACRYARTHLVGSMYKLNSVTSYILACLHNLFWLKAYIDSLIWLKAYGSLKKYARSKKISIEFLDDARDDLDRAYLKYMQSLEERAVIKVPKKSWW